jgi:hypothetical protein
LTVTEEARKVFEGFGAETRVTVGGPGAPARSIYFNIEASSATDLGGIFDRAFRDSEFQSLQARVFGADGPIAPGEATSYTVLDLGLADGPRGRVGQTVLWRPAPGRAEDALGLAKEAGEHMQRLGACRCRVVGIMSGERSGCYASISEHESHEAQGRTRDALAGDGGWQKLSSRILGDKAPGRFITFVEWLEPGP